MRALSLGHVFSEGPLWPRDVSQVPKARSLLWLLDNLSRARILATKFSTREFNSMQDRSILQVNFSFPFWIIFIRRGINKEKTDINLMGFCNKGHMGALCDSCLDGYAKLGSKFFLLNLSFLVKPNVEIGRKSGGYDLVASLTFLFTLIFLSLLIKFILFFFLLGFILLIDSGKSGLFQVLLLPLVWTSLLVF